MGFQTSSKHNDVLEFKCRTCSLLLIYSFNITVCFPCRLCCFFVFFCVKPCCFVVCIRDSAGLQTASATRVARPSTRPTGETMDCFVLLGRLSETRRPVMLGERHRRLGFSRGCRFTSGQGRIDLRFRRSMLSARVLGGSPHECQQAAGWIAVTISSRNMSDAC